jgi:hypothetical protein
LEVKYESYIINDIPMRLGITVRVAETLEVQRRIVKGSWLTYVKLNKKEISSIGRASVLHTEG